MDVERIVVSVRGGVEGVWMMCGESGAGSTSVRLAMAY
jgi:hypothetical protein